MSASSDAYLRIWDTGPRWKRWRTRREREKRLEDARDIVTRLFAELGDAKRVADRLEQDEGLDADDLEAAWQLVLKRSLDEQRAD